MEHGAAGYIAPRLALWAQRTPRGLARAEFESEFAHKRAVELLGATLGEAGLPLEAIELPTGQPVARTVAELVERLAAFKDRVVSVSGFDAAFPDPDRLKEAAFRLNAARESLAPAGVRQIWWMTPRFAESLSRSAPDLDSWFTARVRLDEVTRRPSDSEIAVETLESPVDLRAARERATETRRRVITAIEGAEGSQTIYEELGSPAVAMLRAAGAPQEAKQLEAWLQEELFVKRSREYRPTRVFLSYAHGDAEHQERILALANRLRAEGVNAALDQYEEAPPEGWPQWMLRQIEQADFVLVICDEKYQRRLTGQEEPGRGLGARWESTLMLQDLYHQGAVSRKFIPVLLRAKDENFIPTPLHGFTHYRVDGDEGYEALYRRVTGQPEVVKPPLGKLRVLPPRPRRLAAGPLWNVPHPRNPWFRGRDAEIQTLHAAFRSGGRTALTQAISGLGGVGKTQTAVEFAYRYQHEYRAVLWTGAESDQDLRSGFAQIARLLRLPEKDARDQDEITAAVRRWLETHEGWLLIFDNADNPVVLRPYWPHNAKGHVLVTSRARRLDELGIGSPVSLDVLDEAAAVRFLLDRTGSSEFAAGTAREVAQELGRLPLALEQAAAYMVAFQSPLDEYLTSYRKRRGEMLTRPPVVGDYPHSVMSTWRMNFEQLERSPASADLLRFSAFLSPDDIPLELLVKGAAELGEPIRRALLNAAEDPAAVDELLEPLTRYSLIRRNPGNRMYSVHRLVQEVTRLGMDPGVRREWAERALNAVNAAFVEAAFGHWAECERLLPHALAIASFADRERIETANTGRLLHATGRYLSYHARYSEAESLLRRALEVRECNLGPDHRDTAQSQNELAVLLMLQGRFDEAEPLVRRALHILQTGLGPDHPEVAQVVNNLAALLDTRGQAVDAEHLYRRALGIRERALGSEHPDLAQTANNLGALLRRRGNRVEAEALFRRALGIWEGTLGPDHPNVAHVLNNLGALLFEQDRRAEAEPLLRNALAVYERALGPHHPDTINTRANLTRLLRAVGRDAEAHELARRTAEAEARAQ